MGSQAICMSTFGLETSSFHIIPSLYGSTTPGIGLSAFFNACSGCKEASSGAPVYTPLGKELDQFGIKRNSGSCSFFQRDGRRTRFCWTCSHIHFCALVTCLKTRFESTRSECAFFC